MSCVTHSGAIENTAGHVEVQIGFGLAGARDPARCSSGDLLGSHIVAEVHHRYHGYINVSQTLADLSIGAST